MGPFCVVFPTFHKTQIVSIAAVGREMEAMWVMWVGDGVLHDLAVLDNPLDLLDHEGGDAHYTIHSVSLTISLQFGGAG